MGARRRKPTGEELWHLAENRPDFLNPLVAYFCFGWKSITVAYPPHGVDQVGKARVVPNYVKKLGIDTCFSMLMDAPDERVVAEDPSWIDQCLSEL